MGYIYAIRNAENNMIYIGKTVNSIDTRWKNHSAALACGIHSSIKLQKDYNLFGKDKFYVELVEEVDIVSLSEIETYWIIWAYKRERCYNDNIPFKEWMTYIEEIEFSSVKDYKRDKLKRMRPLKDPYYVDKGDTTPYWTKGK